MIITLQTLIFFRESLLNALDRILRPYYNKFSLTFGRNGDVSDDDESDEQVFAEFDEEKGVVFYPPVYLQRYAAVSDCLLDERWCGKLEKVVDLGYHDMSFIKYLKEVSGIRCILGVDIESIPLRCSSDLMGCDDYGPKRENPLQVTLFQGNAADPDYRLIGCDVVIAIEMIEHMLPQDLDRLIHTVFGFIKPWVAIFTTPNGDFNVLFKALEKNGLRRLDHFFEWSREQFHDWCSNIVTRYPEYTVSSKGIGPGPPGTDYLGCCSQMAVFTSKDYHKQQDLDLNSLALVSNVPNPYNVSELISTWDSSEAPNESNMICAPNNEESYTELYSAQQSCVTILITSPSFSLTSLEYHDKTSQCNLDTEAGKNYMMFDYEQMCFDVVVPRRKVDNRVYMIEDVNSRLNCTTLQVKKFSKTTQNLIAKNKVDSLVHTREVVDEIRHLTKMLNFNKDSINQPLENGVHTWNNINWGDNAPYWNQYYKVVREYNPPYESKSEENRITELISDEINRLIDNQFYDDFSVDLNRLEIPIEHLMSVVAHITDDVDKVKDLLEWDGYEIVDNVVIHSRLVLDNASTLGTQDDDWPDNDTYSDWDSDVRSTSLSDGSTMVPDIHARCLRRALDQKVRKLRTMLTADEDITTELDKIVCRLMKLALRTSKGRQSPPPTRWMQCKLLDLLTLTEKAIERRKKYFIENYPLKSISSVDDPSEKSQEMMALEKIREDDTGLKIVDKYRHLVQTEKIGLKEESRAKYRLIDMELEDDLSTTSAEFLKGTLSHLSDYEYIDRHSPSLYEPEPTLTDMALYDPDNDKTKLERTQAWLEDDLEMVPYPSHDMNFDDISSGDTEHSTSLSRYYKKTYKRYKTKKQCIELKCVICKRSHCNKCFGKESKKDKKAKDKTSKTKITKKSSKKKSSYSNLLATSNKYVSVDYRQYRVKPRKKEYKSLQPTASKPIPASLIELCHPELMIEDNIETYKEHIINFTRDDHVTKFCQPAGVAATEKSLLIDIVMDNIQETIAMRRTIGTDAEGDPMGFENETLIRSVSNTVVNDFNMFDKHDIGIDNDETIFLNDINEPSTSKGIRHVSMDVQCGPDTSAPNHSILSATTSITRMPNIFSAGIKIGDSSTKIKSTNWFADSKPQQISTNCCTSTDDNEIVYKTITPRDRSVGIKIVESIPNFHSQMECSTMTRKQESTLEQEVSMLEQQFPVRKQNKAVIQINEPIVMHQRSTKVQKASMEKPTKMLEQETSITEKENEISQDPKQIMRENGSTKQEQKSPMPRQQSPVPRNKSFVPRPQSPMSKKQQSPMSRQQSSLPRPHSPMLRKQSGVSRQQSPLPRPQSPKSRQQSAIPKKQSPLPRPQSPLTRPHSPLTRPLSPLPRPQSPLPRPQSPLPRPQSPLPRPQSPLPRPQSPLPRPQSPLPKPQSPLPRSQSPLTRPQSPLPRPQSLLPRSQSPLTRPQSPLPRPQSPLPRPQSPLPRSQSRVPRPPSPKLKQDSPVSKPQSPAQKHRSPTIETTLIQIDEQNSMPPQEQVKQSSEDNEVIVEEQGPNIGEKDLMQGQESPIDDSDQIKSSSQLNTDFQENLANYTETKCLKSIPSGMKTDSGSEFCGSIVSIPKSPSSLANSDLQVLSSSSRDIGVPRMSTKYVRPKLSCGGVQVHSYRDKQSSEDIMYQGEWQNPRPKVLTKRKVFIPVVVKKITDSSLKKKINSKDRIPTRSFIKRDFKAIPKTSSPIRNIQSAKTKTEVEKIDQRINTLVPNSVSKVNRPIRTIAKVPSKVTMSSATGKNTKSAHFAKKPPTVVSTTKDVQKTIRTVSKSYLPYYLRRHAIKPSQNDTKNLNTSLDSAKTNVCMKINAPKPLIRAKTAEIKRDLLKFQSKVSEANYVVLRNDVEKKSSVNDGQPEKPTPESGRRRGTLAKRSRSPQSQNSSTCSSPNSVATVRAVSIRSKNATNRRHSNSSYKTSTANSGSENTTPNRNKKFTKRAKSAKMANERTSDNKENIPQTSRQSNITSNASDVVKGSFLSQKKEVFIAQLKESPPLQATTNKKPKSSVNIPKTESLNDKIATSPTISINSSQICDSCCADSQNTMSAGTGMSNVVLVVEPKKHTSDSPVQNPNNVNSRLITEWMNNSSMSAEPSQTNNLLSAMRMLVEETLDFIDGPYDSNNCSIDSETVILSREDLDSTARLSPISFKTVITNENNSLRSDLEQALNRSFDTTLGDESILSLNDTRLTITDLDLLSFKSITSVSKYSEYLSAGSSQGKLPFQAAHGTSVKDIFERKDQPFISVPQNNAGAIAIQAFSGFSINGEPIAGDRPDPINFIDSETGSMAVDVSRQANSEELFVSGRSSDSFESCLIDEEAVVPSWLFQIISQQQAAEDELNPPPLIPLPMPDEPMYDGNGNVVEGLGLGAGAGDGRGMHSDQSQDSSGRGTSLSSSATSSGVQSEGILLDPSAFAAQYEGVALLQDSEDSSIVMVGINDNDSELLNLQGALVPPDSQSFSHGESRRNPRVPVTTASDVDADVSSLETDVPDSSDN